MEFPFLESHWQPVAESDEDRQVEENREQGEQAVEGKLPDDWITLIEETFHEDYR
jgi:hypothetical protein